MANTLEEIAQELKDAVSTTRARTARTTAIQAQLIYAFNGTGKTRLSKEFTKLISPNNNDDGEDTELTRNKILYYNAFTEDLFSWDNDLENDLEPKLKIFPNTFTNWILKDQGQDQNIIANFQRYTDEKLTPYFNEEYLKDENDPNTKVEAFSEVTFSFERGDDDSTENIKISKGEESNFIWSIFYTLIEEVVSTLNIPDPIDRDTNQFDNLEYIFIDDPVSSLDENHLIDLAIDLARLIKSSESEIKFVITTHNPLFYNVLHNELNKNKYKKYIFKKKEDGSYELKPQSNDSPFSYHLYLKEEIQKAIETGEISKYHFNYMRNILEKTSTFFGTGKWGDLLPENTDTQGNNSYARVINLYSHSKISSEEIVELSENHKLVLGHLLNHLTRIYNPDLTDNATGEIYNDSEN